MPDWLSAILEWLRLNPQLAGLVIGAVAFLEGLAVVGIIVPGIVILFGFGALVGYGVLELWSVWLWCSAGAIAGDGLSFWLGHHFKDRVRDVWPFTRYPSLLRQGEMYFRRHGLKSVVIGRFIGPIRPIIPVVAGMLHMPIKHYLPANIVAGLLWAPAYLLPGLIFGASVELAQAVAWRLALLLLLVGGAVWLLSALISGLHFVAAPFTRRWTAGLLAWSVNHPRLAVVGRNLVDPKRPESGSLVMLAVVLLLAAAGSLWLLITVPLRFHAGVDLSVAAAVEQLRSPWTDYWMAMFAGLSSLRVVGPSCVAVLLWLLLRRQRLAAGHLVVAFGFGVLLAGAMVLIDALLRDQQNFVVSASVGHVASAVSGYGFLSILLTRQLPLRGRVWPYVACAMLVLLASAGHVYLGIYEVSEVLLGISLGAVWVLAVGIAYRRRARRHFLLSPAAGIFFAALLAALVLEGRTRSGSIVAASFPPSPPDLLTPSQWVTEDRYNADEPVSFWYRGPVGLLLERLERDGWSEPPAASWQTPIAMLQPDPSIETLPLLPATVGNYQDFTARVQAPDGAEEFVALRLWPTHLVYLGDGRAPQPIWAGSVARYRVQRVLYFFHFWRWEAFQPLPPALLPLERAGELRSFDR